MAALMAAPMRTLYGGPRASALVCALAALAAGCALQSPPSPADVRRDALPNTQLPARWKAGLTASAPPPAAWLASFDDPTLSALVAEALAYNADLKVAAARVEQAAGMLQVASSPLLPQVGVAGVYSGKSGGGGGLNALFLNASLELDVWGRLRYGEAAAQAQSESVQADYAYARQSLAATVAKSWFLAIEAGLQRVLVDEALRAAQELHRVARERMRVGIDDEQAVAEAAANAGNYRDLLRQTVQARDEALRALELLLGRYPAAEIAVAQHQAPLPAPVPTGLPSDTLERRPDVIAAERRVAAAFNRVGEAKAARLPRISLTAGVSAISSDVLVLQDRSNPGYGFGANLFAPLYQGGALRAQVDIRNAEQSQAMAEYARIAQRSFGEVENALGADFALRDRDAVLARNIADNERALELAQVQFRVGKVDLRVVEQRQLALYSVRTARLRVQTDALVQRTNLYLALGGGFEPAQATASRQ
jgi:NodT family efflux transporter outer membrane factor (OMF) lipoprotein